MSVMVPYDFGLTQGRPHYVQHSTNFFNFFLGFASRLGRQIRRRS